MFFFSLAISNLEVNEKIEKCYIDTTVFVVIILFYIEHSINKGEGYATRLVIVSLFPFKYSTAIAVVAVIDTLVAISAHAISFK